MRLEFSPTTQKKIVGRGGGGILENSSQWDAAKQIMRHVWFGDLFSP